MKWFGRCGVKSREVEYAIVGAAKEVFQQVFDCKSGDGETIESKEANGTYNSSSGATKNSDNGGAQNVSSASKREVQ